jgi:hypothetical protein
MTHGHIADHNQHGMMSLSWQRMSDAMLAAAVVSRKER